VVWMQNTNLALSSQVRGVHAKPDGSAGCRRFGDDWDRAAVGAAAAVAGFSPGSRVR
jgi:hypothetical protein